MRKRTNKVGNFLAVPSCALIAACGGAEGDGAEAVPFALNFVAVSGAEEIGCADPATGFGPRGQDSVGVADLRFYISNVRFYDGQGRPLAMTLDANEFQYIGDRGSVSLIDLTSNRVGTCSATAIAFAEGTARTNARVTGTVVDRVQRVDFDVGVPQPLMKDVIATHTAEGAPSPLAEMDWGWAAGHRHFVFNFTVADAQNAPGEGYVHVGSRDCGGDGARALTDRDACGLLNTPSVSLEGVTLDEEVQVDVAALLSGVDFVAPIYDTEPPFAVIGEGPGVSCHSAPPQAHCTTIFRNLGIDLDTGVADPAQNRVFSVR